MRIRVLLGLTALVLVAIVGAVALLPRTSSATGVVVAVDARSLTDVRSFSLRVAGGEVLVFSLTSLENGAEFPPGHLAEHIGSAEPILVTYRDDGGSFSAIRISDAPEPSTH